MSKNNADLYPYRAPDARLVRKKRRRGDEDERAWPIRTWVISDGTAGMLAQGIALTKAMKIQAEDIRAFPTPLLRPFPN